MSSSFNLFLISALISADLCQGYNQIPNFPDNIEYASDSQRIVENFITYLCTHIPTIFS